MTDWVTDTATLNGWDPVIATSNRLYVARPPISQNAPNALSSNPIRATCVPARSPWR